MKRWGFLLLMGLLCAAMLGCATAALTEGNMTYTQIDQETARAMMARDDGHVVVDVRRQDEYDAGHIPGAILIPNESIANEQPEALPDLDQIILIYCRSGNRSKQAAQKLAAMGYATIYEFGGINTWTGEIVTSEEEARPKAAELVLRSFDGGGPEYGIAIEDPEIVTWSCRREYDDSDHGSKTGAPYRDIYTLTGLKPGETVMTVSGRSPIAENYDARYAVVVDEALNVTLRQEREISAFELSRNGYVDYDSYTIHMLQDSYAVSVNDGPYRGIDAGVVDALYHVVEEYDLFSWDGFHETREGVLDGEGFWLEIVFTDGTSIFATGSNAFPQKYFTAVGEMQEILDGIGAGRKVAAVSFLDFLSDLISSSRERVVGTDIAFEAVSDFYYTYATSTFPPEYQRYRFYMEDGAPMFFHERREGERFPLQEEDVTVSGTVALTEDQWARFCACLEGGTVRTREESVESGDSGPWFYLYWSGDQGEDQQFAFASLEAQGEFEALCAALAAGE